MATLAANANRVFETGDYNKIPMIAADIIYKHAAVGLNSSGYARPLVAGDAFVGFADASVDNSSGGAGAKSVSLITLKRVKLSVTGVTGVGDVNKPVYASDDNTFTLTASTNSFIGRIIRYETGTVVIVEFDGTRAGLASLAPLTENTGAIGGTNDGNLPDLSSPDASINAAAIRELATRLNTLTHQLK